MTMDLSTSKTINQWLQLDKNCQKLIQLKFRSSQASEKWTGPSFYILQSKNLPEECKTWSLKARRLGEIM